MTDVTHESCVVSWSAPDSDGGTPLTGYVLERRAGLTGRWLRITRAPLPDPTCPVGELVEGNSYEFRAVAINKVGESEPGPSSQPITAKDPWGEYPCPSSEGF